MNKAQKVILSIWILVSFGLWFKEITIDNTICNNSSAMLGSCIFERLVVLPLVVLFIVGIPTFVLFKIWQDKKAK